MVDVDPNMRVYEAQFFGLDHCQDDAQGDIHAYAAQVDKILVTLDRHEDSLIEKYSTIIDKVGSRCNEDMYIQQHVHVVEDMYIQRHVHVVVNIRSTM